MLALAPPVNRIQDQRDFLGPLTDGYVPTWDDAQGGFVMQAPAASYTDADARAATGWQDDGATVRLVTLTNHVGIGTASPDYSAFGSAAGVIGIEGSSFGVLNLRKTTASATLDADLGAVDGYNGTTRIAEIKFAGGGALDSGELRFYTRASGGAMTQALRLTTAGQLLASSGTISAPGIAFNAETGLGLYRGGVANRLNVAVGGNNIAAFGTGTSLSTGFVGMVEGKFRCYGFSCTIDGTYTWDVTDRTGAHGVAVPVTTHYHASQSGYYECATGAAGSGASAGGYLFGAGANSTGHKFICGILGVTNGSTANQYGGVLYLRTKADGATTLHTAHFDQAGVMDIPNGLVVGEGLGTINAGCIAQFTSTTKALLLPRVATTQRDLITGVNGMIIYNPTTGKVEAFAGGAWTALH